MINLLLAILLIGITFYVSIIYGSAPLALLGFAQAAFVVLSFCFLLLQRHFLHFSLQIPIRMAQQDQSITLHIHTGGLRFFDLSQLRFCMEVSHNYQRKKSHKRLSGTSDSTGANDCAYEVTLTEAGRYELTLKKVRLYDVTGFLYLTKKVDLCTSVDVLPDLCEIPIRLTEPVLHYVGDSDVYDDFRPGHDVSETLNYRPFQPGDRIQNVHWKLSARCDELMVKENGLPKACPVTLLLDQASGNYLKAAASLSFSIMDAGCPHYVAWYSNNYQDVLRLRVDDEESLYEFLLCFLQEKLAPASFDINASYEEKYHAEPLLHHLYLDLDLHLYEDGELLTAIDCNNIEHSLSQMEVIL